MTSSGTGEMSSDTDPDLESIDAPGPEVELPTHASAYHEPRTPPPPTAHQTLERQAVHIGPEADYLGRLGHAVDRHAPTVQRRVVPAAGPRARRASTWIIAALAIAGGGLAGWVFALTGSSETSSGAAAMAGAARPDPEDRQVRVTVARAAEPPLARTSGEAHAMPARVASRSERQPMTSEAPASKAPRAKGTVEPRVRAVAAPPTSASSSAPASSSPTIDSAPSAPERAPSVTPSGVPSPPASVARPRSWLSEETPKAWVR